VEVVVVVVDEVVVVEVVVVLSLLGLVAQMRVGGIGGVEMECPYHDPS